MRGRSPAGCVKLPSYRRARSAEVDETDDEKAYHHDDAATLNKQDGRLTIGLDLGDRSSFYCVLDEAGEVLLAQKVSTTPKAMKEIFGAMPRSDRTGDRNAFTVGKAVCYVNSVTSRSWHTRSVRLIGESRRKDDRLDAHATRKDRSGAFVSGEAIEAPRHKRI
jgi:hypothetical protein